MMIFKRFLTLCAVLTVAACGGGGGASGTSSFGNGSGSGTGGGGTGGGTTSPTVSDLAVQLSAATIANSGTGTVVLKVTALDANRVAIPNATLQVSANNGAVVTLTGTTGAVTDTSGQLLAAVSIGSDTSLRDITLSATAGSVTRTAVLKVVSSPVGAVPTSIELIGSATSVGTGGDGVVIRAFVKDANNNALPNTPVTFSASTGTLSAISTSTDESGAANATLSAGADKSNRSAVVTVTSGIITSRLTLPVSGTTLRVSGPTSLIRGAAASFDLTVSDSKNNPVPGVTIAATSSLGNALTAVGSSTTNASGQVSFSYTATAAGNENLVFTGAGTTASPAAALQINAQTFAFTTPAASANLPVGTSQPITVQLQGVTPLAGNRISFAATGGVLTPSFADTDASGLASVNFSSQSAGPVTVQATVDSSGSSTTVPLNVVATTPSALVLQASQTSVAPNVTTAGTNQLQLLAKVTDAAGNPVQGKTVNFSRVSDPSGGNLLQVSAVTDASGVATVTYRSGSQSTANNGVVLSATVASTSVTNTTTITVSQSALFIALGTGNVVDNLDPQTYKKDWVVYVTDSNGVPVNGVTLTIKAIPKNYRTGRLAFIDTVWTYTPTIYGCRSEDTNQNGNLDANEDDNSDGVLWPGNVIAVTPGSVQTVNGRATVSLIYAESYAPWVDVLLTATATVSGTESKTEAQFVVSGLVADFNSESAPPAGVVSPYGLSPKPEALARAGACQIVPVPAPAP